MPRSAAITVAVLVACSALAGFFLNAPNAEALRSGLQNAYEAKLGNPEYVDWKSLPGIPSALQEFPEEVEIKRLRSQLAALVTLPSDTQATTIPSTRGAAPKIDGTIESGEWSEALRVDIGIDGSGTELLVYSDGEQLFLACDVPADTTGSGYDQFRFYMHLGLTPLIVNERIHVGTGTKARLGGIRQTTVRWRGRTPASNNERWMKYPISDWQIYDKARGLASIGDHRQYEAVMNLEEAGLHPGVPFRAWVQVETDPARNEAGKFDHRVYAGQLGAQETPHWFTIEKPAS